MRISGWDSALVAYIESKRYEPHAYGSHDCCYFVFGAVQAMTGDDRMAEFRGKYDTMIGSLRALKEIGQGDLVSTMDAKFPSIPKGRAGRGDIALLDDSIGIVMGDYAWFVGEAGLERVPRGLWDRCWGVDRG